MKRVLTFFCLLLLPGCMDKPKCGPGKLRMELRDGDGALQLRVAESAHAGELDLCDPKGERIGALGKEGAALVLFDRNNAELLRAATPDTFDFASPRGAAMRLAKLDSTLRVLDAEGVPFGSLYEKDGVVLVSDQSGTPLAKVSPRSPDAVVAGPDGVVRHFVVPSPGLQAAAVLALDKLPLPERVFVAAHLGRGRLQP